MRFSDICNKQVINIADGSLVGLVVDLSVPAGSFAGVAHAPPDKW